MVVLQQLLPCSKRLHELHLKSLSSNKHIDSGGGGQVATMAQMVPFQLLLQCKQGSGRVSNLQNTISGNATARHGKKEHF